MGMKRSLVQQVTGLIYCSPVKWPWIFHWKLYFHTMSWFRQHKGQSWDCCERMWGCKVCFLLPCVPPSHGATTGSCVFAILRLLFYSKVTKSCQISVSIWDLFLDWNWSLAPPCNISVLLVQMKWPAKYCKEVLKSGRWEGGREGGAQTKIEHIARSLSYSCQSQHCLLCYLSQSCACAYS